MLWKEEQALIEILRIEKDTAPKDWTSEKKWSLVFCEPPFTAEPDNQTDLTASAHSKHRRDRALMSMLNLPQSLSCAKNTKNCGKADNGSHFVTRYPRDPSVSWPVTRVTHDPVPDHGMSRSRLLTNHDEFTTIAFYSLQSGMLDIPYAVYIQ